MKNLNVTIKVGNELADVKTSMIDLFAKTFSVPPRNEVWTEATVAEHLQPIVRFGFASVCLLDETLLGFNTYLPIQKCRIKNDINKLLNIEEGCYLSDAAVHISERGYGIGQRLLSLGLCHAFSNNEQICVVRTRVDAIEMRQILEKHGFSQKAKYSSSINGSKAERLIYSLSATDYFIEKSKKAIP